MQHNEVVQKLQSNFSTTKNLKESGIPWLGKIPKHWEMTIIRSCFDESDVRCKLENYPLLSVTQEQGIVSQENITTKKDVSNDDKGNYKIVPIGGIAYNKMRMWQGAVGLNEIQEGIVSPAYVVVIPKQHIFSKFALYLFKTPNMIEEFGKYSYGLCSDMNSLRYEDFQNISIPLPPLEEQKAIADFLDKKTHQIEEFITKKQKLITLLEEKKQTLINQCVTQGLDPSTSLKDSGVEWLGKIPTHWEVKKLKLLFGIGSGLGITKADFVPSGIPCVSYGEIHSKYPCRLNTGIHPLPYVSEDYLSSKPQALLKKGDFVFADTSEDIEGSGNFTSLQSDDPVFAGYHTIVLKPKTQSIHSPYFSFLFDSLGIRNQVRKEVCGVKVYSITKSILKEVQCLIPPLEEQKAIAEYLDTQIEKIDLAICKIKSQINLIKEYKTTLISEAVCGRVEIN